MNKNVSFEFDFVFRDDFILKGERVNLVGLQKD